MVAARDGLVTKVQALDGQAQVLAGTTVTAGQVLISGVVDSDRRGYRLLHGLGQVGARPVRYAAAETERTEAEARAEGQEQLLRQLQVMLDAGEGQLLRHSFDAARQGKWLVVTLRAECEEQIGVSSPLSTDGTE